MVSKTFTLHNKMGFHMRPANLFVAEMTKYTGDVTIVFGERRIDGRSIMNIMASCIKCGAEITVECDGADEQAMLDAADKLITDGFGEE
ncbi:MAG: HPr family phosphocarrier protein [Clostridia bacterium]|nr:HPr family phosphocarrier protein [Clostridia bacterium]